MSYQHKSKPSRIWSFRAKEPVTNLDLIFEQFRLSNRYYNALVEAELIRRGEVYEILRTCSPDYVQAESALNDCNTQIEQLATQIKAANARARAKCDNTTLKEQLKTAKAKRKALAATFKTLKAETFAREDVRKSLDAQQAEHNSHLKQLRAHCGLYWGNYLSIEQSLKDIGKGTPPKFKRFTGEGRAVLQLQGGLSIADAYAGESRLLCLDRGYIPPAKRHGKSLICANMRIGSDGRDPIWSTIPFYRHREFPNDAQIKWVYLQCRNRGPQKDWHLQFVLSRDQWEVPGQAQEGVVGIDLGWRKMGGDLRVGYYHGSDGEHESIELPEELLSRYDKVEQLQSIQDKEFNTMVAQLLEFASCATQLPTFLQGAIAHMRAWRKPWRLVNLYNQWNDFRFDGDAGIFTMLGEWRKRAKRLWERQQSQQKKNERKRNLKYRELASELSQRYGKVHLEDVNWQTMMRCPEVGESDTAGSVRRKYAHMAAPGTLRQYLLERFRHWEKKDSANTTKRCHQCQEICQWDAEKFLIHTCEHCGATWDQDHNAAINLCNS